MTRTTVIVVGLAILVGVALAGGLTLIRSNDSATPGATSKRSLTDERAPEAENHSAGDLPAAEASTRRFLAGYLPVVYGKPAGSLDKLRSASPRLIAALKAEGARVTPAQAQRTPHIQRVAVIHDGTVGALATAQIKDSPAPAYPLVLHLETTPKGWVVTRIGSP